MRFTKMCNGTNVKQGHARKGRGLQEARKRIHEAEAIAHTCRQRRYH